MGEVSFLDRKIKLDCAEDAQEIVDAIKKCDDLESLQLQGNTLGLEAARVIADALKNKKTFKKALWSDMYTGRLRSEIPPSLKYLGDGIITAGAKLSILDLSDNAFGPDGVEGIKKLLMSEACYLLHTLKLNNNGLGIGGGKILSEAFIECHKSSSAAGMPFALKVFISGRNRLEDEGAKALSKAFKTIGSLEEITMPQNGIRPEGVVVLAEAFKENKRLKRININDNTCTEVGAKALADCLLHLKELETFNVGDCLIKDQGAMALAPSLAATPSLKTIIISYNEIRRDGALAVAKSMKNKTNLELLNLDGNQLGDSVDEIQDLMTSYSLIDALGSFDDNEDEEDGEEEEEGEVEQSGDEEDLTSQIGGMGLGKSSPAKTTAQSMKGCSVADVRTFVENPKYSLWIQFDEAQRKTSLQTFIKEEILPSYDKVSRLFVQICDSMEQQTDVISEISDCILGAAFSDTHSNPQALVSSILVHMGLLKAETKVEKVTGLKGPLSGLESVILKEYFPRAVSQYFIAFLLKPNVLLDGCNNERHCVLQKLYQK